MEGVLGDGDGDASSLASVKRKIEFSGAFQYYLDRWITPHSVGRWMGTLVLAAIYVLRVYYLQGFYIISYALWICVFCNSILFVSPKADPELEVMDGASLPTKASDEFKPFIRKMPEFEFWYSITIAFCVALVMTCFSLFDLPASWPILICFGIFLFVLKIKHRIRHMIKYRYIPFSIGKQKYTGKKSSASNSSPKD
ncbi:protein RER1B-like [Tasmannia lanceolata]|uniref:protein RER1B-like n=1 Tax=Tasmannia lanceolata TaxID=3420 RepID=UPI004062CB67